MRTFLLAFWLAQEWGPDAVKPIQCLPPRFFCTVARSQFPCGDRSCEWGLGALGGGHRVRGECHTSCWSVIRETPDNFWFPLPLSPAAPWSFLHLHISILPLILYLSPSQQISFLSEQVSIGFLTLETNKSTQLQKYISKYSRIKLDPSCETDEINISWHRKCLAVGVRLCAEQREFKRRRQIRIIGSDRSVI